jgi:hypothetical protein
MFRFPPFANGKIPSTVRTASATIPTLNIYRMRTLKVLYSIFLILSHMFGYQRQKLLGRSRKSLFFLKPVICSAVRNLKFRHMFCRNKKFCSVKSRFPVHLPQYKFWTILALYRLFLWRFQ